MSKRRRIRRSARSWWVTQALTVPALFPQVLPESSRTRDSIYGEGVHLSGADDREVAYALRCLVGEQGEGTCIADPGSGVSGLRGSRTQQ